MIIFSSLTSIGFPFGSIINSCDCCTSFKGVSSRLGATHDLQHPRDQVGRGHGVVAEPANVPRLDHKVANPDLLRLKAANLPHTRVVMLLLDLEMVRVRVVDDLVARLAVKMRGWRLTYQLLNILGEAIEWSSALEVAVGDRVAGI